MSDAINFGMDEMEPASTAAGSGVGVVKVGKRDYAVGLLWNSVEVPANASKEARARAKTGQIAADLFCVRSGLTAQFGLGFKSLGHKASMPSLAAHLAFIKSGSWIGLFEVVGGYYLIAVRDDGIIAETDRVFVSAEDAQDEFENLYNQSEWADSYCPASLNLPGTRPESLDSLVTGKPPARLSEVDLSKTLIRLGIGIIVVVGGIFGGMSYLDSIEAERLAEEARIRSEQAKRMFSTEKEIEIPPMPWENKPLAVPTLANCVEAAGRFPADLPGWRVSEVFCQGNSIAVAVDREGTLGEGGGPVTWLARLIHKEGFTPEITFPPEGSGTRVRVQWTLQKVPTISPAIETMKLEAVRRGMLTVMEGRMTPISFSDADSNDFWKGLSFRFTTRQNPTAFGDLLGAVPGVIMTRIHHNVSNGEWNLEGKVYEQLPPPKNAKRK